MSGIRRLLTALALLTTCAARLAAQGSADALTLDVAIARALRGNPDLILARLRGDSARAETAIARSYANPAVSVSPNNPWQYSVSAPLDLGPQRFYRVRSASEAAAAAAFDAGDAERQVRFAVRSAFLDLVLADTMRAIVSEQRDVVRDLLAADSVRVRAGDIPERNLVKGELELAKADAALAQADASLRAARLALQLAMGVERPDTALRIAGSLALVRLPRIEAGVTDSAVARRPDIRAADARAAASASDRRLAGAFLAPVPELVLVQQRDQPFPNGQHYALGVGAEIPVWNWFSGERRRADASLEQARVSAVRVRAQARVEITAALDQFHAAERLAWSLDSATIAKAARALETARFAYRSGAISYVELLDAVRTNGEIRADAAVAAHDYWVGAYAVMRALDREIAP